MNEEEIRLMVGERLRKGILPRNLTIGILGGPDQPVEEYSIHSGLVMDHLCSACDREKPDVTYGYLDKQIWFHEMGERIWKEERQKVITK
jgi:hypothetical protein